MSSSHPRGRQLTAAALTHPSIICDGCGMRPLTGLRFKCTRCSNFDLCLNCWQHRPHDAAHRFEVRYPRQYQAAPQVVRQVSSDSTRRKDKSSFSLGSILARGALVLLTGGVSELALTVVDGADLLEAVSAVDELHTAVQAAEALESVQDGILEAMGVPESFAEAMEEMHEAHEDAREEQERAQADAAPAAPGAGDAAAPAAGSGPAPLPGRGTHRAVAAEVLVAVGRDNQIYTKVLPAACIDQTALKSVPWFQVRTVSSAIAAAVSPSGVLFCVGTDGLLYAKESPDLRSEWFRIPSGPPDGCRFIDAAFDTAGLLHCVCQDSTVVRNTSTRVFDGQWVVVPDTEPDIDSIAFDHDNVMIVRRRSKLLVPYIKSSGLHSRGSPAVSAWKDVIYYVNDGYLLYVIENAHDRRALSSSRNAAYAGGGTCQILSVSTAPRSAVNAMWPFLTSPCTNFGLRNKRRKQPFFQCRSCWGDEPVLVCMTCVLRCHADHGHDIAGRGALKNGACACGPALCSARPKPELVGHWRVVITQSSAKETAKGARSFGFIIHKQEPSGMIEGALVSSTRSIPNRVHGVLTDDGLLLLQHDFNGAQVVLQGVLEPDLDSGAHHFVDSTAMPDAIVRAVRVAGVDPQAIPEYFAPFVDLSGSWRVCVPRAKQSYSLEFVHDVQANTISGHGVRQRPNKKTRRCTVKGTTHENMISFAECWAGGSNDQLHASVNLGGFFFRCVSSRGYWHYVCREDCLDRLDHVDVPKSVFFL